MMIKMKQLSLVAMLAITTFGFKSDKGNFIKDNFENADKQITNMLAQTKDIGNKFPRTTNKSGAMTTTSMYDWTPGFFPGSLWLMYEFTKSDRYKNAATQWTEKLEPLKTFTGHHDLGFMMYCSYGNAYKNTQNPAYKNILIQSAKSLSTRFNATTGTIKSWNKFESWHGNKTYYYPVIIDNMMNLEMLYFATKASGDTSFSHIATTHAINTLKHQIRKDYSHYHVVCYDSVSGKVIGQETAQGYADNSTWARGQAWGIYGFTMVYRETKDPQFLAAAKGMANFFINNKRLPKDKIPYWDFNANEKGYIPGKNSNANNISIKYRDASATAITASALFELSTYVDKKTAKKYKDVAIKMLQSLSSKAYKAPQGTNGNFILEHSVGSIPHNNEIDVPLVYADYYYIEALLRYNQLLKGLSLKF